MRGLRKPDVTPFPQIAFRSALASVSFASAKDMQICLLVNNAVAPEVAALANADWAASHPEIVGLVILGGVLSVPLYLILQAWFGYAWAGRRMSALLLRRDADRILRRVP
jgi:hypothetical protein